MFINCGHFEICISFKNKRFSKPQIDTTIPFAGMVVPVMLCSIPSYTKQWFPLCCDEQKTQPLSFPLKNWKFHFLLRFFSVCVVVVCTQRTIYTQFFIFIFQCGLWYGPIDTLVHPVFPELDLCCKKKFARPPVDFFCKFFFWNGGGATIVQKVCKLSPGRRKGRTALHTLASAHCTPQGWEKIARGKLQIWRAFHHIITGEYVILFFTRS